jgi:hypothetical protein
MPTPLEIRDTWLKKFYEIYMKDSRACVSYGLDTFDTENRREIEWLISEGWLDRNGSSLRLSVEGRNEYERRQAHGGGQCPTCGRE